MTECLEQIVEKQVGYEAEMAEMTYSVKSVEEMAVSLNFGGYSDKLFHFVEDFLKILKECAKKGGFEESDVMNSIESA